MCLFTLTVHHRRQTGLAGHGEGWGSEGCRRRRWGDPLAHALTHTHTHARAPAALQKKSAVWERERFFFARLHCGLLALLGRHGQHPTRSHTAHARPSLAPGLADRPRYSRQGQKGALSRAMPVECKTKRGGRGCVPGGSAAARTRAPLVHPKNHHARAFNPPCRGSPFL